jgi:regulator of sigma E protease
MDIIGSIFWLVVALGLLVTFHEFGHYWVARRAGVGVLRFSVGFGRPLLRRQSADGVEFVVAAIPLGGYVKMLDEREAPVPDDQLDQAFNRKSLGKRTAIVAAGPVFNLIFAVAAFWLMFMIGIPEPRPMVGETEGIAAEAGLERGDVFVRIGDDEVETWTHTILALIPPALDREPVEVVVADAEDRRRELTLPLDRLGPDFREEQVLEHIGLQPWRIDLPPVVGEVSPDSPARAAGVRAGDRIVAVNGDPVDGWRALLQRIPAAAEQGPIELQLERDGETRTVTVAPTTQDGRAIIGVVPVEPDAEAQAAMERATTVLRHGPVAAVGEAVGETWRLTTATLGILGRMIIAEQPVRTDYNRADGQHVGQAGSDPIPVLPRPDQSVAGHHQPAADSGARRRSPAVFPDRMDQGQPGLGAGPDHRPEHWPGHDRRPDGHRDI